MFGEEIFVRSSNLESIAYDEEEQILRVRFKNGRVYDYYDVEWEVVEELINAPSVGSYFYHNIRTNYDYRRVK